VTLDFEALRRAGLLVPGEVKSDLAHQFRRIKRPLLKNASAPVPPEGNPGSLVMITSAIPGEGKTFCAINLAMSMAMEVDTAVLLVDADVVRPSVLDRLGIQVRPPGLLDLLTQPELALGDAVMSTNVPKLSILSAGVFHEQSTELLASAAMGRLLERLVSGFADHILIFDGPPLLPTTESAILASKVGQVVVVVEAQRTSRVSVQQAFASLRGCPIVMSVLNKTDEAAESRNYGYAQG
jgi:exopolysaccharide/PEP-CTERM locus tyrosine autokinase